MRYCTRCTYPANARPTIHFDKQGVCSGCLYHESRQKTDWVEREAQLSKILDEYKAKAKENNQVYDCIIPVSGDKDSNWQVFKMKVIYGMNPLLVSYNHVYNSALGIRNLRNLVEKFNCDLVRFTANPESVKKISRYMLKEIGDVTWHYHSGITAFAMQSVMMYNIPLIIWGEVGFVESGWEPDDLVEKSNGYITRKDVQPYIYPSDEDIERVGVCSIYLSNFLNWDSLEQTKFLVDKYGFELLDGRRDGTFSMYHKTDDHCNSIHAYLEYLKFGYGRATYETSEEIRYGRMSREAGIVLVKNFDGQVPSTLDRYVKWWGMTRKEFYEGIDHLRDPAIWKLKERLIGMRWGTTDSIVKHIKDQYVDDVRLPLVAEAERTTGELNKEYYNTTPGGFEYLDKVPKHVVL